MVSATRRCPVAEPIAWAVLCRSGKLHGWADTAEKAEFSRGLCDQYMSVLTPCGPHRVAPLYALTDEAPHG